MENPIAFNNPKEAQRAFTAPQNPNTKNMTLITENTTKDNPSSSSENPNKDKKVTSEKKIEEPKTSNDKKLDGSESKKEENLMPRILGGDAVVDEDDLLANRGPGESASSDPIKQSTTTQGTFSINAPDGIDNVTIGGNALITNGIFAPISFTTLLGSTLKVISYNAATGEMTYQYTLNNNQTHPLNAGENDLFEDFLITLSDVDGDTTNSTLSIRIIDDLPTAINDTNVLTNDIQGADGAVVTAATLVGTYGSIIINQNGTYTYTLFYT